MIGGYIKNTFGYNISNKNTSNIAKRLSMDIVIIIAFPTNFLETKHINGDYKSLGIKLSYNANIFSEYDNEVELESNNANQNQNLTTNSFLQHLIKNSCNSSETKS